MLLIPYSFQGRCCSSPRSISTIYEASCGNRITPKPIGKHAFDLLLLGLLMRWGADLGFDRDVVLREMFLAHHTNYNLNPTPSLSHLDVHCNLALCARPCRRQKKTKNKRSTSHPPETPNPTKFLEVAPQERREPGPPGLRCNLD